MEKLKVLISDDEPYVVSTLARLARQAGLNPIGETSSENVVELARTQRPDVIILDINQGVDGRDLLARLKQDPSTQDIHVVVLSARDDQFTRHTCFELGAEDYTVKPFDLTFMSRIARLAADGKTL
jgi:two-component system, OmpR family, response regulator AdeR